MAVSARRLKDLTALRAASYFFVFAVCAKGVFLYATHHPPKQGLLSVQGIVSAVVLGGKGDATSIQIHSQYGTQSYSSYYGIVWPGMERIKAGDLLHLLVERDKTNNKEFFTGKRYYFWEVTHQGRTIVSYEDVRETVRSTEAIVNRYIDLWLTISCVLLLMIYIHKLVVTTAR